MSRLDWEKQNAKEKLWFRTPEHVEAVVSHSNTRRVKKSWRDAKAKSDRAKLSQKDPSAFQRGVNCGKAQERQTIITKLDAIRAKESWAFESEIYQLIETLRKETYWPRQAKEKNRTAAQYKPIEELRKETK